MSDIITKYNLADVCREEKAHVRLRVFGEASRGFVAPKRLRAQLSNTWFGSDGLRSTEKGMKQPWTPEELEKMNDYFWASCIGENLGWKGGFATAAILRQDLYKVDFQQDGNFYETLTPNLSVKPFFDLEAYIPIELFEASKANRVKFLKSFIDILIFKIKTLTGVELDSKTDLFITDASRPETDKKNGKVSYHLIIQNKIYFQTITDHQVFVVALFTKPFLDYVADPSCDKISDEDRIFLQTTAYYKNGTLKSLVDTSVYDCEPKHCCQQFKMPYQSKAGAMGSAHIPIRGECANGWEQLCGLYFGPGDRQPIKVDSLLDTAETARSGPSKRISMRRAANGSLSITYTPESYVFVGKTLQEKFKIDDKDLLNLSKFSRAKMYLYLIPNGEGVLRPFWLHIGFACKAAGLTLEDWNEWTSLYPGHSELTSEMEDIWDSAAEPGAKPLYDDSGNRLPGYDIRHLKMVAKKNSYDRADKKYKALKAAKSVIKGKVNNIFESPALALGDYFSQDVTDIEVIQETSKYLSTEEDAANIQVTHKHLIYDAAMGKGKTQAIKRIMGLRNTENQLIYKSVLFLSTRISFANFITGQDFEDCRLVNYKDAFPNQNFSASRLVVSLESIYRIDRKEGYDLIVLDECESVWKTFSSQTMAGHYNAAYKKLLELIRSSKRTVYADAFIMNRTLGFVRHLKEPAVMIVNHTLNPDRPVRTTFELSADLLGDKMVEKILEGKKVFICSGSKSTLDKLEDRFKTRCREQPAPVWNALFSKMFYANGTKTRGTSLIYYNAYIGDADDRDTLHHIRETWTLAPVVMTTPKITVGCSYSEAGQFHATGVYFYPSCCVRDLIQSHMRVRSLVDNEVYYSIPSSKSLRNIRFARTPQVFDSFEYYMAEMRGRSELRRDEIDKMEEALRDTASAMGDGKGRFKAAINLLKQELDKTDASPYELKRLLWQNVLEDALSVKYFSEMVDYFLHYKLRYNNGNAAGGGSEPEKKKMKLEGAAGGGAVVMEENVDEQPLPPVFEDKYAYHNLELIEPSSIETLLMRERTNSASELDKHLVEKYFFNLMVDTDEMNHSEVAGFFKYFLRTEGRAYLRNASMEHLSAIEVAVEETQSGRGLGTSQSNTTFCVEVIRTLLQKLDLVHSFSLYSPNFEKIEKTDELKADLEAYFTEEINGEKRAKQLYRLFCPIGTKSRELKETSDTWTWQKSLNSLNRIFGAWTGGKFVSDPTSTDGNGKNAKFILFQPNRDLYGDDKRIIFRQKLGGCAFPEGFWEEQEKAQVSALWKAARETHGIIRRVTFWDSSLGKFMVKTVPLDGVLALAYPEPPVCVLCQLPVASFVEGTETCPCKIPLFEEEDESPYAYDEETGQVVYENGSDVEDSEEGDEETEA